MKTLFLILSAVIFSFTAYSQSFLGKSKKEIKQLVNNIYDEVEIVSESPASIKMICDGEVNEFLMEDNICIKFNSVKPYSCNCLDGDLKAYNENLKPIGSMKWLSKEGDKVYEILLDKKEYLVSISHSSTKNITALNN